MGNSNSRVGGDLAIRESERDNWLLGTSYPIYWKRWVPINGVYWLYLYLDILVTSGT